MGLRIFKRLRDLIDVDATNQADGTTLVYRTGSGKHEYEVGGGGGGAPTSADYLVGTANGSLSAEIVVGTSPGGELGGTWASPTVDATHSGSSHAAVQAAAEATAAAALLAHTSDASDAHDASAISIVDAGNDFTATDVEGALDELQADAEADATALSDHIADATGAHAATAIAFTPDGSISATTVQAAIVEVRDEAAGGGAPSTADYLVGTAQGGLSAEIVVGTSPGGELGGTWASPTVDASHSGSTHAAVQAAAEATASAALSAHTGDTSDAHDASAISVDSTTLVGVGTDVQAVLEELDNGIADHLADATDAHAGSAITNTAAGNLVATTVQAAINELDTEKQPLDATLTALAAADWVANSVPVGTGADTLAQLSMGASTILARLAAGNVVAATPTELRTLLDVPTNAEAVLDTLFDANTVLAADSDNTPAALTMGASTILARLAAGNIKAATPSELRTLLSLVIGTNVQAWDTDLDAIAALSPSNDDIIQRKSGAWTNRTLAQIKADLGLTSGRLFLSAAGMYPSTTAGCQTNTKTEQTTNDQNVYTLDFDSTTAENAEGLIAMPADWDGGTVTATFYWMATGTSTNSVVWYCQGRSYGDSETLDQAFGTLQQVTDAHTATAQQVLISSATPAITLSGTPAAGELVLFRVGRLPADGSDDLAVDAQLLGVQISYSRT